MDTVLDIQTDKLAVPRRLTAVMKEIWALQPRFEQRSGRRPFGLLAHERFRAGFDFLVLRSGSGEAPEELAQWRSEEHTSELQSPCNLVCRLLLEKKKKQRITSRIDYVHFVLIRHTDTLVAR